MASYRIISSDDHVFEPPDLWTSRIEPKYRERAPRIVRRETDGTDWWVCDGVQGVGTGTGGEQVGKRFEEPDEMTFAGTLEQVRPGAYIPEEHVKDMDIDWVDVSIMYPTEGLFLYSIPDGELLTVVLRTYNDWIAEFCQAFAKRLKGVAMLNVDDVGIAVNELERCANMELVGAMITVYPTADRSYDRPEYERLWTAAQDLRMPLSLHVGTNRAGPDDAFVDQEGISADYFANKDHWVRMSLAHLIYSGVFERYPKLQVGSIEMELAWVPHFPDRLDYCYSQLPKGRGWHTFKRGHDA